MAYIFLDESGDLGFDFTKGKTSKYFVITFLYVRQKGPVEKIVKKTYQSLSMMEIQGFPGILHCSKERPKTRVRLLRLLCEKDASIITICLNKKKVYTQLQDEKQVLYNYVTNILLDRLITKKLIDKGEPIHLIASQRETNAYFNNNFKTYIHKKVQEKHKQHLQVEIKKPSQEKCLQVVDFACWAIYQKYEKSEPKYYDIIKGLIAEENMLYP